MQQTRSLAAFMAIAALSIAAVFAFASSVHAQATTTATTTPTTATSTTFVFTALLSGLNEVPAVFATTTATSTATSTATTTPTTATTTATTTPATGTMMLWFDTLTGNIRYTLRATSTERLYAGHLHCGVAGENGPVVVPLFSTATSSGTFSLNIATTSISQNMITPTSTATSTCGGPITTTSQLAQALLNGRIYVNIHSVEHPDGVARGQLLLTSSSTATTTSGNPYPGGNGGGGFPFPGGNGGGGFPFPGGNGSGGFPFPGSGNGSGGFPFPGGGSGGSQGGTATLGKTISSYVHSLLGGGTSHGNSNNLTGLTQSILQRLSR